MRPASLTNTPATGRVRAPRLRLTACDSIGRVDVAASVLQELDRSEHLLMAPTIATDRRRAR